MGERFDVPEPDELVFIGWFSGGGGVPFGLLLESRAWPGLLFPTRA